MSNPVSPTTYRDAGVDIDAGQTLVDRIAPLARQTFNDQVLNDLGGFGGLFQMPDGYRKPVLVCGTDGVGTKLRLARQLKCHDTLGIDLVAMCVNDILAQGARPLLFLDYYACAKLEVEVAEDVMRGIAAGCQQSGCALLGGETAEMPGMYKPGDYDLAGFAVGVAEKSRLLPRPDIAAGDCLIGLDSSGLHANGFSLVHHLLERGGKVDSRRLKALLEPTIIYTPYLIDLLNAGTVQGLAHITGGGLTDNVPRMLPAGTRAAIDSNSWQRPELFDWIQDRGQVEEAEMRRVFNCGIGMVAACRRREADAVIKAITDTGLGARVIGEVTAGDGPAQTLYI